MVPFYGQGMNAVSIIHYLSKLFSNIFSNLASTYLEYVENNQNEK